MPCTLNFAQAVPVHVESRAHASCLRFLPFGMSNACSILPRMISLIYLYYTNVNNEFYKYVIFLTACYLETLNNFIIYHDSGGIQKAFVLKLRNHY